MTEPKTQDLKQAILNDLNVMEDDIHFTRDEDAMTFYVPTGQLDEARDVLDTEVEVLEEHDYEYLVQIDL